MSGGEQRNSENFGAHPQNGGDWPFLTLRRKKNVLTPTMGGSGGERSPPAFGMGGSDHPHSKKGTVHPYANSGVEFRIHRQFWANFSDDGKRSRLQTWRFVKDHGGL